MGHVLRRRDRRIFDDAARDVDTGGRRAEISPSTVLYDGRGTEGLGDAFQMVEAERVVRVSFGGAAG